jgi:Putative transposase/Transposase zinc-binding domain
VAVGIRVAEILAVGAGRYVGGQGVAPVVAKACRAILACRTSALGGHARKCENGHVQGVWYNACRNRACPRCSYSRVKRWLERQVKTLLGCAHHHIIFTVPHELNVLWLLNYPVLGELLFASARASLFELAWDPRYLGAVPGAILALHTWGQQLALHPHVHCLVSAGGVNGEDQWIASWRKWFLPAEPLKRLFRAKYLYGLRGLARSGRLRLPDGWGLPEVEKLCREAEHKRWNVYVCERYENPTAVLNYLGRYLHGGPIGESRLTSLDGETVTFRYKDYRDRGPEGPREKTMRLDVDEFSRRYLQHVAPKGFHLVRGYGLYRRGGHTEALAQRVRQTLPVAPEVHEALAARNPPDPDPPVACTICNAPLRVLTYPRGAPMPIAA